MYVQYGTLDNAVFNKEEIAKSESDAKVFLREPKRGIFLTDIQSFSGKM